MFKELTMEELLREVPEGGLGVSIYLPKTSDSSDDRVEKTKLKVQLKIVQGLLEDRVSAIQRKQILSVFESCLFTSDWIPRGGSVGLFYSRGLCGYIKIPFQTQERSIVSDSFHLKPVFKWLYAQKRFYLLNLHANEAVLYRGSCFGIETIAREQAEPRKPKRGNQTAAISSNEVNQKLRRQLISVTEGALVKYLHGETAPLLLAGNERMCTLFAEVCSYPFLLSGRISVDSSADGEKELHEKASTQVSKYNLNQEQLAIDDFLSAAARNKATTDLNEVAQALHIGRVKRLFVAEDTHLTGTIHREGNLLTLVTKDAEGDDILDDLAELAAAHRSQVLVLPRKRMPANVAAAATLRW
jgi:hypothetical protein